MADILTRRETQVVRFLNHGLTNKQIARELGIAEDTVKKHLQGVFRKTGVSSRTQIVSRQVLGQVDINRDMFS